MTTCVYTLMYENKANNQLKPKGKSLTLMLDLTVLQFINTWNFVLVFLWQNHKNRGEKRRRSNVNRLSTQISAKRNKIGLQLQTMPDTPVRICNDLLSLSKKEIKFERTALQLNVLEMICTIKRAEKKNCGNCSDFLVTLKLSKLETKITQHNFYFRRIKMIQNWQQT